MGFLRADGMPPANASGIVEEDAASLQLIESTSESADLYLYIEKINISVYKAAFGGSGILTIQTDNADWMWTTNVDGVKDFCVDWGEAGVKVSDEANQGLQAFVAEAGTQASVSVGITAHYDRR